MTFNKSVAVAIATGSLLLNAFATTAFADTVAVTGNGADSHNTVTTTNNSSTTVTQSNSAVISNTVSSSADTGNNDANRNTGGSVRVDTGNALSNTQISNAANLNQANVSCGCNNGSGDITISGNGAGSGNGVNATNTNQNGTQVFQTNHAAVSNNVDSSTNTGYNNADSNTGATNGAGSVTVSTGDAQSIVGVATMANANVASIGSGAGTTGTGTGASAIISGNGADSSNHITLSGNDSTLVEQGNSAAVWNSVSGNANSGYNDANRNTGGNVTVDTGMANSTVGVDNKVNFNAASTDCGCFTTGGDLLKLVGNGADSHNTITDNNGGGLSVFQGTEGNGNLALLTNKVNGNGESGDNNGNANTGAVIGIDPVTVMTGDSNSLTGVSNTGNVNLFGNGLTLPGNVSLGFDMSGLFGMFGM